MKALLLTLVCPGLGQMYAGARARGWLALIAVLGSLGWLGYVDYVAIQDFFAEQPVPREMLENFPALFQHLHQQGLMGHLKEVSSVPGTLFLVTFIYSFADAVLAVRQANSGP